MSAQAAPCRLAVFLSRKARVGVILRRGPSGWVQLIHWDRATDAFTPGHWFHGRVYEGRCDLSPDGKLFIYFAAKYGSRRHYQEDVGEAWTAISRPPYFTALALWPNIGTWYGGGVFRSDGEVLLAGTCGADPHPTFRPQGLKIGHVDAASAPWEQRLLSHRWQLVERGFDPRTHRRIGKREIWSKTHPDRPITLCREIGEADFRRFGGPYPDDYWLEANGDLIPIAGANWAEWDDGDRLAFARDGVLFRASLDGTHLREEPLFDFNPFRPEDVETPDWASRW